MMHLHDGAPPRAFSTLLLLAVLAQPAAATDWPAWRGPEQNGVSRETALPAAWSAGGRNLLWKAPHGGRSTPIVLRGRVYIQNLAGKGETQQERVMCFAAETGKLQWEYRFGVFLTDIPANRVGWASPAGDPETGNVYAHGVQNTLVCLDRDGRVAWKRQLHEQFGTINGYGGRTHTPVVDEDRVIVSFLNSSWGSQAVPRHRYAAFDKRTGAVLWWAQPGGKPLDTTYSVPVVAVVNGVRLLIDGNADGSIYAMKARTGEKVWGFALSKRGINSSCVFWNNTVYATHSEENLDSTAMGRVVAIDATGSGDVTRSGEKWRIDGLAAGYSTPALDNGRLYVCDNSANLHAIDATSGKKIWKHNVGTVMKGSPAVGDGKIFIGEVNARFLILKPAETSCSTLSENTFPTASGAVVEVNGSPAIANGRIYFTTRDTLYAVGAPRWKGASGPVARGEKEPPPSPGDTPALLQVVPADVAITAGEHASFQGRLYDSQGRFLRACRPRWTLRGLKAASSPEGRLSTSAGDGFQAGVLEATWQSLTGTARVRVVPDLPLRLDFNAAAEGKPPVGWIGAGGKFAVAALDGEKVLRKMASNPRTMHGETFFGLSTWKDYTISADVRATEKRRNLPNIGIVNSRYSIFLMGNVQQFRIVSWVPMPRVDRTISFPWDPDTWYRMKLRVEVKNGKGLCRGKVWPRGKPEPQDWTLELLDPAPNPNGSPGLQAYSAGTTPRSPGADVFFDNVTVTRNSD